MGGVGVGVGWRWVGRPTRKYLAHCNHRLPIETCDLVLIMFIGCVFFPVKVSIHLLHMQPMKVGGFKGKIYPPPPLRLVSFSVVVANHSIRGARYLMAEYLKVVCTEFSTIS
jgi:hypothetical protein